jgi:tyrosyl-tRNA synthetase
MSNHRSAFLAAAAERGFIHQCTDVAALDARLAEVNSTGPLAAYVGYDCTADSLHIGNLMSIMLLRLFQETGNKPIVLMGGGTTRIGDPSGKDEARPLLDDSAIARNMAGIGKVFANFIRFGDGPADAIMVNNADWLDELRYIPLLRDVGRHFSVNRMLSQDSVKLRLDRDQPLSFLEFNYLVLQAYDFVELGRRFGCELQMGGSDQWGNIVAGVELGRRSDGRTLFGLTTPLVTTASGAKMGKTAQGAVWLNAERLSPYEYWQFWRNTEDADVGRFLKLFTELPLGEIARLNCRCPRSQSSSGSPTPRSTKRKKSWRPRRPRSPTAAPPPKPPRRPPARSSRRAARGKTCRRLRCRATRWRVACRPSSCSCGLGLPRRTARRAA